MAARLLPLDEAHRRTHDDGHHCYPHRKPPPPCLGEDEGDDAAGEGAEARLYVEDDDALERAVQRARSVSPAVGAPVGAPVDTYLPIRRDERAGRTRRRRPRPNQLAWNMLTALRMCLWGARGEGGQALSRWKGVF